MSQEPPPHGDLTIIFNHVPKAGGTSIIRMFNDIFGEERCFRHRTRDPETDRFSRPIEALNPSELQQYRFITGHFEYGNHRRLPNQPVKYIGVIRDPFDRLMSDYFYNQRHGSAKRREMANSLSFEEYVREKLDNPKSRLTASYQIKYLTGTPDLEQAKRIIRDQFLVCATTPQLDDMQRWLADYFGRPDLRPIRVNVGQKTGERRDPDLSDDLRARLAENYAVDKALFDWIEDEFAIKRALHELPYMN